MSLKENEVKQISKPHMCLSQGRKSKNTRKIIDFSRNRLSMISFQRKSVHFAQKDILEAEKISKVYISYENQVKIKDFIFHFFAKMLRKNYKERIQNRHSHIDCGRGFATGTT